MEKPVMIDTLDKLIENYGKALSLKELVAFSKQLRTCGYTLVINRIQNKVQPSYSSFNTGFLSKFKEKV